MISEQTINRLRNVSIRLKDAAEVFITAAEKIDDENIKDKLFAVYENAIIFSVVIDDILEENNARRMYNISSDALADCVFRGEEYTGDKDIREYTVCECLDMGKKLIESYQRLDEIALPINLASCIKKQKSIIRINYDKLLAAKQTGYSDTSNNTTER